MSKTTHYLVIAKYNGIYVIATPRRFTSWADAELYVASLPVVREPQILMIT